MIINAYAVLAAFVCLLQAGVGLLVTGLGISALRTGRDSFSANGVSSLEDRIYLLMLLALLLLVLNVASWPLLFALLQSYIPQWPGVMCIYGVTRIGAGSMGASRFLPGLLMTLQLTKPLLVFLSGTWFMLYLANRGTRTSTLTSRVLWLLIGLGVFSVFDSVCEAAYLVIPKREVFLDGGCCAAVLNAGSRDLQDPLELLRGQRAREWLSVAFYGINGVLIAMLLTIAIRVERVRVYRWLPASLAVSVVSLPISAAFLIEIAAPRLLGLPFHHCPYDLISEAPEGVGSVIFFLTGCFSVGWACALGWFGKTSETASYVSDLIGMVLFVALFSYTSSVVMLSIGLLLA